jgi:riboflavin biosynthesis pyrimidine reductase
LAPDTLYGYLSPAGTRPTVRLSMIASIDGATAVAGVSGGLGGPADQALFAVLRGQADVVLVAAGTVRAGILRAAEATRRGVMHVRSRPARRLTRSVRVRRRSDFSQG